MKIKIVKKNRRIEDLNIPDDKKAHLKKIRKWIINMFGESKRNTYLSFFFKKEGVVNYRAKSMWYKKSKKVDPFIEKRINILLSEYNNNNNEYE